LIENHRNVKYFFARRLLKEFRNKADTLNTSYKKKLLTYLTQTRWCGCSFSR